MLGPKMLNNSNNLQAHIKIIGDSKLSKRSKTKNQQQVQCHNTWPLATDYEPYIITGNHYNHTHT